MDEHTYRRRMSALIAEHGMAIQLVGPSGPADRAYAYTVGLQRLRAPHPEVVVFGLDARCASRLLRSVHERVRSGDPLPLGEVATGLLAVPDHPVRVDPVRSEWVDAYCCRLGLVLRRPNVEVPVVQLVLPDAAGRWPEDPAVDRTLLEDQPLLSQQVPWRVPFVRDPAEDAFFVDQPDAILVAAAVHSPFGPEGRYELLRAQPLADGAARISDVPWLADHLAVGDVVALLEHPIVPGAPTGTPVAGGVITDGGRRTLVLRLRPTSLEIAPLAAMMQALWTLHDTGRTDVSANLAGIRLNTTDLQGAERALRPFVRDGVLQPSTRRCELDPIPMSSEGCPDCESTGR